MLERQVISGISKRAPGLHCATLLGGFHSQLRRMPDALVIGHHQVLFTFPKLIHLILPLRRRSLLLTLFSR